VKALITTVSRKQFLITAKTLVALDDMGKEKHQLTMISNPVVRPGVPLVFGNGDGDVETEMIESVVYRG